MKKLLFRIAGSIVVAIAGMIIYSFSIFNYMNHHDPHELLGVRYISGAQYDWFIRSMGEPMEREQIQFEEGERAEGFQAYYYHYDGVILRFEGAEGRRKSIRAFYITEDFRLEGSNSLGVGSTRAEVARRFRRNIAMSFLDNLLHGVGSVLSTNELGQTILLVSPVRGYSMIFTFDENDIVTKVFAETHW